MYMCFYLYGYILYKVCVKKRLQFLFLKFFVIVFYKNM